MILDKKYFDSLNKEEKKELLVNFCQDFMSLEGKPPKVKDFEKIDIWHRDIRSLFGSLRDLHIYCGIEPNKRKAKMNNEELKEYLINCKFIDPNYDPPTDDFTYKGHRGVKSICRNQCSCWLTKKHSVGENNRAHISFNGKSMHIYKLSFLLFKGAIPENAVIAHMCDNSLCFNPEHLEAITQKQNVEDCKERGRRNTNKRIITFNNRHNLKDPYDKEKVLDLVKERVVVSSKNEWLYSTTNRYIRISINNKFYSFHKLILANKLGKKYEDIDIARHVLPDGSKPQKNDLNPDHLFEGTRSDNSKDTIKYHTGYSLKEEDVNEITKELSKIEILYGCDVSNFDKKMAQKFKVSTSVITSIRVGRTYKDFSDTAFKVERKKAVVQLDLDGKIIKEYESCSGAATILNGDIAGISASCTEKAKTYKGSIWLFLDDYKKLAKNSDSLKKEIIMRNTRKSNFIVVGAKKPIVQLDLKGNFIAQFDSANDAEKLLSIDQGSISRSCCGKAKTYKKFIWLFEKNYKELISTGEIIEEIKRRVG